MKIIREFIDFNRKIFETKEECPFLFTNSSTDGEFHQSILDVGYNWWQDNSSDVKSYDDMIYKMEREFGYKFALLILLGKYNQQVGNGGHIQYFDNGYASVDGGSFGEHKDIELHNQMIEWFKKAGLDDTNTGKNIYDIMLESGEIFEDMTGDDEMCDECNGDGEIEEDCYECGGSGQILDNCPECDGEGEIDGKECSECGGSGEFEIDCPECGGDGRVYNQCEYCGGSGEINPAESYSGELNRLDDKYYKFDDWEDILNKFAKDIIIEKYPEEWEKFKIRREAGKYSI